MLVTPYDQLVDSAKKPTEELKQKKSSTNNTFRTAIYVFFLFIILSNPVSYKILDIIVKSFFNNIEVIDEDENPVFIGTLIMAVLMTIIIIISA